jgi:hypothetical protein
VLLLPLRNLPLRVMPASILIMVLVAALVLPDIIARETTLSTAAQLGRTRLLDIPRNIIIRKREKKLLQVVTNGLTSGQGKV